MADKNVFADIVPIEGSSDQKKNVFADSVPLPERSPIKDFALSVGKGFVDAAEAGVGIADVYSGGAAGNALQNAGIDTKAARQAIDEHMSPAAQQDAEAVQKTDGFLPTIAELAHRPYYVANVVGESAPSMAAGLAVGRGVQAIAPKTSAALAGAIGEGAVSGGQTAEQIRQDTGTLDDKGTIGAVGSGAIVGMTGGIANVAARAAHVALPTTMGLMNRGLDKVEGNIAGRMVKAAGIEGAEEVVQSAVEQIGQNYGEGKPLDEGVGQQAAIGGAAGAVMGMFGGIQGHHARADVHPDVADQNRNQNDPAASVPVGPLQAATNVAKATGAVQDGSQPVAPAGASQTPSGMGGVRGQIAEAAQRYGVDPKTALTIAAIETGGKFNPDAKNPRSSAQGVFQFMDATRKMFPEVTPEQWQDPAVQAEYGAKFIAATNAKMQQFLGREPSTGEAYMGHLLGAYGASQLLSADPNTPVQDVIAQYDPKRAAEITRLNGMKDLTAGEAVAKWEGIAQKAGDRLGLEQNAFPFTDKSSAEMRVRAAAGEGQNLEVVDHPTVPGRFAALPPLGGDPNEAQPASKVPLIADLPRYDENPTQAAQAVQGEAQGQAAAPAGSGVAVPGEQPQTNPSAAAAAPVTSGDGNTQNDRTLARADGTIQAGVGAVPAAGGAVSAQPDGIPQAAGRPSAQELIARRGLVPGQDYNPAPSAAQAAAGNYKMAHESWNGLPLSIENPAGSTRVSKDPANPWSVDMQADYGYIKRTRAADSTEGKTDRVDFYKPMDALDDAPVWVIDQHDPATGKFDEHKVVLGVNSREEAELIYDTHFNDNSGPQRRAEVTQMSMPEFKAWLKGGNTDSMTAAESAPQMRDAKAVTDGVLPPSIDFSGKPVEPGLFEGVPQAAKYAADNQLDATPVQTEGGYALAPNVKPQVLTDEDTGRVAALNSALESHGFQGVEPLRDAPSPAAALAAHVAEKAFGVKVIHTEPNEQFSGVSYGDRVFLGANEQHPVLAVAGHEVAHAFEGTPLHAQLVKVFEELGISPKEQVAQRQQEEQANDGRAITKTYARNEVVADLNGSMWVDPDFWHEIAQHDESLFRKVAYKFMELATKAVQVVSGSKFDASSIVTDVNAARTAIAQAWATHLNTKASAQRTGTNDVPVFQQSKNPDRDANLAAYLKDSVEQQPMYHGTARDITKFQPKQAGAIFVAPKPGVANDFAEASTNYKAKNYLSELTPEQINTAKQAALADVQKAWEKGDLNDEAIDIERAIKSDKAEEHGMAWDYLAPHLAAQMPVGENVMPLHVRATNPFDYENADHVRAVSAKAGLNLTDSQRLARGSWDVIEAKPVQAAIKALGHDGFYAYEGGSKNLGVYSPTQVKSATGNVGTFDATNPDIRFAKVAPVELPDRLTRNLTAPERGKLRRDVATRLVALFDQLPSADEMAAVAWSGRAARGWYADSARAISHVFGPDANRFTALLAAMSPQTSVQSNLQNAAAVWAGWVKAGRPTSKEAIVRVMGENVQGNKLTDSVLPAWINNSVRALSTPDPENLVISGPKVNSFMQNLRGNVQEVTNDAWMAAYAAVDQKLFAGKLTEGGNPGKGSGYLAMSARVRETAQRLSSMTGDAWTPAEVQETIWSWAKTLYELQESREGGYGAREILDNGELRNELIAATPEFSSLLLDEKYAGKLRQAGYGERIDGLRALPSTGRGAAATGREKAPFAERTQRGHERAAADRLERLRDERARSESATRADARAVPDAGGVRGGDGGLAFSRGSDQGNGRASPLEGLPATVKVDGRDVTFGPFQPAHDAARAYMAKAGLEYNPPHIYAKVDRERATRIAQAFEEMKHDPQNPQVKAAYEAMARETIEQYKAALATGLKVDFIDYDKQGDPYGNPRNAILDVVNNNHMWVFSTRDGFGQTAITAADIANNPMLAETGFDFNGKPALVNDLFRVVHDYFGHIKDGVGFRADGEENAWRSHAAMYSELARKAMTTETRGQNSWVNFGPYGEKQRNAKTEDTVFAEQKQGILPQWVIDEGRTDDDLKFSRKSVGNNITHWIRQHAPVQKVFYSALMEHIAKDEAKKLPAIGWKSEIKAAVNKGLVRAEEVKWSGVNEWLDMHVSPATHEIVPAKLSSRDKEPTGFAVYRKGSDEAALATFTTRAEAEKYIGNSSKLSARDVVEFIGRNGVRIEEKIAAQDEDPTFTPKPLGTLADIAVEPMGEHHWQVSSDLMDRALSKELFPTEQAARERGLHVHNELVRRENDTQRRIRRLQRGPDETQFSDYTVPGGKNYREMLLLLPPKGVSVSKEVQSFVDDLPQHLQSLPAEAIPGMAKGWAKQFDLPADELELALRGGKSEPVFYAEHHWGDTPNVLAHVRMTDRHDTMGKKTLFIEELQSDWGAEARKNGMGDTREPLTLRRVEDEPLFVPHEFKGVSGIKEYVFVRTNDPDTGGYSGFGTNEAEARENLYGSGAFSSLVKKGAPEGPYVHSTDAWLALALKRMVKYAVDQGYDRVAFANGEQNAAHYNLEKTVKRMAWDRDPGPNGHTNVYITPDSGGARIDLVVNGEGVITRSDRLRDDVKGKGLDAVVGKELAERIMSTPSGVAEGEGLKVGGRGMRNFYDGIVPQALKKMLPKFGSELGAASIRIDPHNDHYVNYKVMPSVTNEHAIYGVTREGSEVLVDNNQRSADAAKARVRELKDGLEGWGPKQVSFEVTDKMRMEVAGGVPLFLKNAPAAVAANPMKDTVVTSIKESIKGKWTDLRSLPLAALGGRQIAEVYGKDLPQLPQYQKLVQLMQAGVNDYAAKADEVARAWGKVKDERQLAELMHDSTLGQIDPSKAYVAGDPESTYKELRERWEKLTPEAQKIYQQARDMYEEHYAAVRQSIRDRIERAEISAPKKSEMLTRMDGQFFERIKGVYFPLARFGDYVLVVRDQAGKTVGVSRAETKRAADTLRRDLKTQYGNGYTVSAVIKAAEFNARRDAVGSEFLESLFKVLDQTGIGEDLQDDINQLVLSSMPDLSWAKHGIHRKGTAGFSQDARRAFAQNMFHGARYLQRVRFGDRLESKLREAEKYVKGRNELTESVKEQQVLDEVRKRHELLMNPLTHPWSSALTSLGFFFHLGLSPASAIVNLTQTPLIAFPVIAGKFGYGRSAAALTRASGDTMAAKNDLSKALKGDELAAVTKAIDEGVIDVTMAHDLAGIAQGEDSKLSWKLRPALRAASYMFHHAERFNRQATFLAAYRLARESGQSSDAAYETASDLTIASHFDYSSSNRPRAMQGNVAKVVLQFKQYGQNMTYTLGNNVRLAFKGDVQAMKTLGGLLVMNGMAAGALGIPLVAQAFALASMIGGSDDEPWDAKVALQNYLADAFNPKMAEVLMHGVSRLGPADISGRTSLDLYKMWFPDVNEALEGQKAYESFATGLLGPVIGGIGVSYAKAFSQIAEGKYQDAMESMAPAVLRGPLKAFRFATDGAITSDGIPIKEDVSAAGVASQAVGFRPSEVANAQEGRGAIMSLDQRLNKRRASLLNDFAREAMKGDDTSSVMADIQKWNETNPTRVIAGMHLQQAVANRTRRIAQADQGVYLPPKKRDLLLEGRFAAQD